MAKMDVRKGIGKVGETIREGFGLVFDYDATQRRGFAKRVREVDDRLAHYLGEEPHGTMIVRGKHGKIATQIVKAKNGRNSGEFRVMRAGQKAGRRTVKAPS